jgi:hypothetical protein
MKSHFPFVFLALFLTPVQSSGQTSPAPTQCAPSAAVRLALGALPDMSDYGVPYEERMKPLRALLAKYPRDIFVQQRYQDTFKGKSFLPEEFDRAFAMYRSRPADPLFRYLEARLTAVFDAARAEAMLNEVLAKAPGFAWPHLAIAELTDRDGARDAKKADVHLRAFVAACPASPSGYAMLRTVEDRALLTDGAVKLRRILQAAGNTSDLLPWHDLWELEFRIAPAAEQETVRRQVVRDAESLTKHAAAGTREWLSLLLDAARLTKDPALQALIDTTVLERFPASHLAASVESARWSREHPRPPQRSKPEDVKAYRALQDTWQGDFERRWSNTPLVIVDRFVTLTSRAPSLSLDERLSVVDRYLALKKQSPDCGGSEPPPPIIAAERYARWGARLDQVPAMIQAGLKQAELESAYRRRASMYSEEERKTLPDGVNQAYWRAQLILADLYLQQRKVEQARDAIQTGVATVDLRPVMAPGTASATEEREYRRRSWLSREARLAELLNDPQRALAIYQRYLQPIGREGLSNPGSTTSVSRDDKELIPRIKVFYLANGGTEDGWLGWATAAPADAAKAAATPEPLVFNAVLPEFEIKDLSGRTWRLARSRNCTTGSRAGRMSRCCR